MYTKEMIEYMRLRHEQGATTTTIGKEIIKKFNSPKSLDAIRMKIDAVMRKDQQLKERGPVKRLFFDIETSYVTARLWRAGKQWVNADNIVTDKKIICISYKWQYEDKVHTLTWDKNHNDKTLVRRFIKILEQADEIVGHNGDRFDIKELRTRAILNNELMFPMYRTFDTLKKARKYFNFNSNKLDYLGKILNVGRKLDHEGFQLWVDCVDGKPQAQKKALKKMVAYCEMDVILLEDVFLALSPFVDHNTNFAILKGGNLWECPECASSKIKMHHTDTTAMGVIRRHMKCDKCKKQYKISNKTYMKMLERLINER